MLSIFNLVMGHQIFQRNHALRTYTRAEFWHAYKFHEAKAFDQTFLRFLYF
jgi:hypothetical protein